MEDRHIVAQLDIPSKDRVDMVGVFDGHGGHQAAEELIHIFPEMLAHKVDKVNNIHSPREMTRALYTTVLDADYKMYEGGEFNSGSTGVIALWPHDDNYLYIANLGDSRAIVWSENHLIIETIDHKPSLELDRITASGGFVRNRRVGGYLAVSRSFGDYYDSLKLVNRQYSSKHAPVSAEPDIYMVDMRKHPNQTYMVLATDGLWDVMNTTEVMQLVSKGITCKDIITEATRRGSTDNITIIIVDIPRCGVSSHPSMPPQN